MTPAQAVSTLGGVGYIRPAPGTWGSLVSLPVAWLLATFLGFGGFVVALALSVPIGLWAIAEATKGTGDHDPSEIVIDELSGQWIALLPVVYGANLMQVSLLTLWPGWVAAFVLFRLFDIWKPGPVGWADRREDPVGTLLDDLIAGAFAALGVIALAYAFHGVMR